MSYWLLFSRPKRVSNRVLFPAPLAPMMASIFPASATPLTLSRICWPSPDLLTAVTVTFKCNTDQYIVPLCNGEHYLTYLIMFKKSFLWWHHFWMTHIHNTCCQLHAVCLSSILQLKIGVFKTFITIILMTLWWVPISQIWQGKTIPDSISVPKVEFHHLLWKIEMNDIFLRFFSCRR